MLFTTLDITRREDDMPESDVSRVARIDPGSGQKVIIIITVVIIITVIIIIIIIMKVEQPVLVILKQMLPVYQQLCAQYNNDPDITEAVCSNLKQGVSTLQDDIRPLTQDVSDHYHHHYHHYHYQVLNLSVLCYRASPQPAALELCKQFFIMYVITSSSSSLSLSLSLSLSSSGTGGSRGWWTPSGGSWPSSSPSPWPA